MVRPPELTSRSGSRSPREGRLAGAAFPPPRAGCADLGPDFAGRAVAPGDETEQGLSVVTGDRRMACTPVGAIAHRRQLGAALNLDPAVGPGLSQHPFHAICLISER
jgi:hypothetical protein